jgi:hypothetical protein
VFLFQKLNSPCGVEECDQEENGLADHVIAFCKAHPQEPFVIFRHPVALRVGRFIVEGIEEVS